MVKTAAVSRELDTNSAEEGAVYEGLELTALETKTLSLTGMPRVRFEQGWASECERDGTLLLQKIGDEANHARQISALAAEWAKGDAAKQARDDAEAAAAPGTPLVAADGADFLDAGETTLTGDEECAYTPAAGRSLRAKELAVPSGR